MLKIVDIVNNPTVPAEVRLFVEKLFEIEYKPIDNENNPAITDNKRSRDPGLKSNIKY